MRRVLAGVLFAAVVAGCGSGSSTPGTSVTPIPATAAPTAGSSEGTRPTAAGSTSTPPPESHAPADIGPDTVVEVVTDDLRVRTAPGTGTGSVALEPLLERGSTLVVIEGPVEEDGYAWVHALTMTGTTQFTEPGDDVDQELIEHGWIAVSDTNGDAWLARHDPECPPVPEDMVELAELHASSSFYEVVLACFGDEPITFDARLFTCPEVLDIEPPTICQMDTGSPTWEPEWFDRTLEYIVPMDGEAGQDPTLELHLDPQGTYPDPFPYDEPVRLTGQFNHPAASACTVNHYAQTGQPTAYCRSVFVVTRVEPTAG